MLITEVSYSQKNVHMGAISHVNKNRRKLDFDFFRFLAKKMEIFDLEFGNRPSLKLHHINLTAVVMTAKDDTNSEVLC